MPPNYIQIPRDEWIVIVTPDGGRGGKDRGLRQRLRRGQSPRLDQMREWSRLYGLRFVVDRGWLLVYKEVEVVEVPHE